MRGDNMYTIALLLYAYVILGFIEKKIKNKRLQRGVNIWLILWC